jgi:GNAT superfamily N-acetyltransferase
MEKINIQPASTDTDRAKLNDFMRDVWRETTPNPFDTSERVWMQRAAFTLSIFDGAIHISAMRSFERGKGDGSKALDWLCQTADVHGVTLSGGAKPYGDQPRLNSKALRAFYRARGFEIKTTGAMRRAPRGKTQ